jgi:hypothetical protein
MSSLPIVSFHFISFHFISFHFISFHFISFHFISFHFISFHFISFRSYTLYREGIVFVLGSLALAALLGFFRGLFGRLLFGLGGGGRRSSNILF